METENKQYNLYKIAEQQQGYFTAKQAVSCGYSHRIQHYHKTAHHWQEIERGVFRLVAFPATSYEDLVRWSLWSRDRNDKPQAVFSHETALAVHELGDAMPGKIHFTVLPGFRKKAQQGCVIHKKKLSHEMIEQREGFMVTAPLQTIIDVVEDGIDTDYLKAVLSDAITKGMLLYPQIDSGACSLQVKEKIRRAYETVKQQG